MGLGLTRDETVAPDIGGRAGFEEHVALVEEQDGVPFAGQLEDLFERLFDLGGCLS